MKVRDFKELTVWQNAIDIALVVYDLTERFPKSETYSLCDQLRRASVSIASNIAEGQQRNNTKEFVHFLGITKGSLAEVETQLIIAQRRNYMTQTELDYVVAKIDSERRMLNALIKTLRERLSPPATSHQPPTTGNV